MKHSWQTQQCVQCKEQNEIDRQWRTGPPGNREISRWAPASGIFSGPRPYMRIYFIDNQLTQSADRLSSHRAWAGGNGRTVNTKRPFCVFSPFVGHRATYNVHLRLEIDFLLVLIELFANCYRWVATSEYRLNIGDFAPTSAGWPKISSRWGRPLPTILLYRKLV